MRQGAPRPHCRRYWTWLDEQPAERLAHKRAEADALFHRVGITFAVYGENAGTERLIPFDIVPRILPVEEWRALEAGLKQRVRALNAFIRDVYHEQEILQGRQDPGRAGADCNAQYRPEMQGVDVPAASTRTSPASTSCATARASSACWKTTCACPRACRTCSRTAR